MRHKQPLLFAVFLISFGLTGLQAQENVIATGGEASSSGGSVSYSVGQVCYQVNTGANGSLAEGVQQPYEISEIIGIAEAKNIALEYSAHPNPVAETLTLSVEFPDDSKLTHISFQLLDEKGHAVAPINPYIKNLTSPNPGQADRALRVGISRHLTEALASLSQ